MLPTRPATLFSSQPVLFFFVLAAQASAAPPASSRQLGCAGPTKDGAPSGSWRRHLVLGSGQGIPCLAAGIWVPPAGRLPAPQSETLTERTRTVDAWERTRQSSGNRLRRNARSVDSNQGPSAQQSITLTTRLTTRLTQHAGHSHSLVGTCLCLLRAPGTCG